MARRLVLIVLAVGAALPGVLGCGGGGELADGAVAEVGDTVITRSDFERALSRFAGPGNDPRDDYDRLKSRVMRSLIQEEWVRQEANRRGIVVTESDVSQALDKARKTGFLGDEALKKSGVTLKELLPGIRQAQLEKKVMARVTASDEISAEEVATYYRENKQDLVVEERRDLRVVLTTTRGPAEAARAAIDGGRSWESVAKQYSQHDASRDKGGRVTNLRKGVVRTGLVTTAFRAQEGALTGPVKVDDPTWAVFIVERVKPAFQASLSQARDEIEQLLAATRRQQAVAAFTSKYREKTTCAPGFTVPSCKNGSSQAPSSAS